MQDEISRMSKKELERALRNQLQSGQNGAKKSTVTKRKNFEDLTADELILMHRQSGKALTKLGIEVPTDALFTKVAERNLQLSISTLAFVLTRILDAYQHSKTHAQTRQAEQLCHAIEYIGQYESGGRLDEQLDLTIETTKSNLRWVADLYQALGYARGVDVSEADLAEGRAALKIASAFGDATRKLLNRDDKGESLIAAMDTYQGNIQRLRGAAMRAAAPHYGGPKSDIAMNADILDTVRRLGVTIKAMQEVATKYPQIGDPEGDNDFDNFKKRVQRLKVKQ